MGKRVPKFKSLEEEAAFWDATDFTELNPSQLVETVLERPKGPLSSTFAIRLDQKTVRTIRRLAKKRGVGPTQLVRTWVLEKLRAEGSSSGENRTPLEEIVRRVADEYLIKEIDKASSEVASRVNRILKDQMPATRGDAPWRGIGVEGLPLQEILTVCQKHRAKRVRVFGSRARGDALPTSDLDLLISFRKGASLFDLIGIEDELEDLLGLKVDVVSEGGLRHEVRDQILNEAKEIAA